jgi:HEAT repeat protein/cyclophilin family peptidyl-prolyl cis-trans isomerase
MPATPLLVVIVGLALVSVQPVPRKTLTPADVDDIARLLMLEDTRELDEAAVSRMLHSAHPEVRRRAAIAVGRIAKDAGRALLMKSRTDSDSEVVASVAFATGQLKDADAIPWLLELLLSQRTAPGVAREAAIALGKIQTPEARAALARFLADAPTAPANASVAGAALLAIGRVPGRGDLAPIVRWTKSPNVEIRWRAAWALFRSRDAAAGPHLLLMSRDASAEVRCWAVRGLARPAPPAAASPAAANPPASAADPTQSPANPAAASTTAAVERLRAAVKDPDRRVRTEAIRALATYGDDESFAIVLAALDSPDLWLSVSAAETMGRFPARAAVIGPRLIEAAAATRPLAVRSAALTSLVSIAPEAALDLASLLALEHSEAARDASRRALQRLGDAGRARLDELVAADPSFAPPARGRGAPQPPAPAPVRTLDDYRRIAQRWVVPDYNGVPKPRAVWTTPRGAIEIELYAGDAPLAVDYFVQLVESGAIVGTEFGRVVPNFVAQQRTIANAATLRDEVNRRGLTRGNLSWASAGLDTGRPGYTLGHTPQPHNEGSFTSLGRILRGMDVVDRLELGDAVTATRMVPRPAAK